MAEENKQELTMAEILDLASVDMEFYTKFFFEGTFRDVTPWFHKKMWGMLEQTEKDMVGFMIPRGFAKTTITRGYCAKRIAYAMSRTILVVGVSQESAVKTTMWIKKQVLNNTKWAQFFQLTLGNKTADSWFEIHHGIEDVTISVVAVGITGNIRGLNLDDYRPDFIIADDPCDEENTGTPEQRKKIAELFYGALHKSLAPKSEAPSRKMVLLQTALNSDDLINMAVRDPAWMTFVLSCFDNKGKSTWPERFPTKELQTDKASHINRNQLVLWLREMESRLVAEGTASFRAEWLQYWEMLPDGLTYFLWIDPVPPPSEREIQNGLKGKDFEVLGVVGTDGSKYYLVEYVFNRGHDPDWTLAQFWMLVDKYSPQKAGVETVNYQRTLKWLLEKSMQQRGRYIQLDNPLKQDRRKKSYRIVDNLTGVCSNKSFYVHREQHREFIDQFTTYPVVNNDDIIETVGEAARLAQEAAPFIEGEFSRVDDDLPDNYIGTLAP